MKRDSLSRLPDTLLSEGRSVVTAREIAARAGVPRAHVYPAVARWRRGGRVFVPARGVYVLVPPQYRSWRVVPAEWFIDAMMRHLGRRYYVGLLTAAALHGAAHQAPQVFQALVDRQLPGRDVERLRIRMYVNARIAELPLERRNTPTGTMAVSGPELTVVDLVDRPRAAGGLGNVATVIAELAERLDVALLARVAGRYPRTVASRLGWLLERHAPDVEADALLPLVAEGQGAVLIDPSLPRRGSLDRRWRVRVNTLVEADL